MMRRSGWWLVLALGCGHGDGQQPAATYLSKEELMDPESCAKCHKKHYQEWSGSMHAYAAEDPLFVAMNKRGQREGQIGKFCVNCHAPMAVRTGATEDGLNLDSLPKKLKGVTCYVCHSVDAVEGTHDNPLHLAEDGVMRGQFGDPVANTAHAAAYSTFLDRDRLESAQLCGSCHDIVNGHGAEVERTYAEWQATVYSQKEVGTTCSQCHMHEGKNLEPAAEAPGVFSRKLHSHEFPGVDVALTPFPEADTQKSAVQAFLHDTLQSALCVRGTGESTTLRVYLDNVAAGHKWPSGAAQDRRAWVELTAYVNDAPIYQSGVIAAGAAVTASEDPDLWLMRDCMFDEQGNEVHMFWEAQSYEANQLPGQLTFNQADMRFYMMHIMQAFPRRGTTRTLTAFPDRVSMRVHMQPVGLDVVADLVASGDLSDAEAAVLGPQLPIFDVGDELVWTAATATEMFSETGQSMSCISNTELLASSDKDLAINHTKCKP
jgi:Cytochrome c554 and c-prime